MNSVIFDNMNYNKIGEIGKEYQFSRTSSSYSMVNTSGTLNTYGIGNTTGFSLASTSLYSGQTVTPNISSSSTNNLKKYYSNTWNKNIDLDRSSEYSGQKIYSKNLVRIANLGTSAKYTPSNLKEQLALEQVKSNPLENSKAIMETLGDSRWKNNGWEKRAVYVNGIDVHYLYNQSQNLFDDFKIAKPK